MAFVSFTWYVIKHTHLFFSFQIKRDDVFNNCKVVYTKPLSINTFPKVYNAFSSLIGTVDPAFHLLPTFIQYSMLHVYGVVSYQTWHHLKTSKNKFTTFDVNRPPYIRFASYLYEFMYQHISSLKSTPDPFNTSLWSSHSGYNSTIPSYSFCQECILIFIVMVVNISDTYCQKTTTKHLSSMRNVCASNKSI